HLVSQSVHGAAPGRPHQHGHPRRCRPGPAGHPLPARRGHGRSRDRRSGPRHAANGAGVSGPEFGGLVAIVTGGASGIGLATARLLADRGATVAVLDREPGDLPQPLTGFTADVTDRASVETAVSSVA